MSAGRRSAPPDREIARFREIVAETNDSLLLADNGPCNADAPLLDLCAEALHLLNHSEALRREHRDALRAVARGEAARLWQERNAIVRKAKPLLSRIRKLRAVTGPGIYAKALVVRASITGAPHLAKSLAEDLIACRELRATLWASGQPDGRP